jgi:nicotinate phosphoribosyltransferase
MDKPIIESLLDTDQYKFTTSQFAYLRYPKVEVEYTLTNRHAGGVQLAKLVDLGRLREELDNVRSLSLSHGEVVYLASLSPLIYEYIEWLRGSYQLPDYELEEEDGQIRFSTEGEWAAGTLWETFVLSILT